MLCEHFKRCLKYFLIEFQFTCLANHNIEQVSYIESVSVLKFLLIIVVLYDNNINSQ